MLINMIWVMVGGGLGSVCRYLLSLLGVKIFGNGFPIGTLSVNLLGCFLIGLGFSLAERNVLSPTVRLLFMTGFLGGLTTFSTYALESTHYIGNGQLYSALLNITINNVPGLALVFLGLWLGKAI